MIRLVKTILPWLAAGALLACGGTRAQYGDQAGGEGEGEGAEDRLESDVFVDDSGELAVDHRDPDDLQVLTSQEGRAQVVFSPETLAEDVTINVVSMPLSDFTHTGAIIDGVYLFDPVDTRLLKAVQILLPTNGLPLWEPEQVELVMWPSSGTGWQLGPAVTAVNEQHASAFVRQLGIYGLRVVGGFANLPEEVPTEGPVMGNCPADGVARGSALGQVLRDPELKDATGTVRKLYDLCDKKAILIVSAGMW